MNNCEILRNFLADEFLIIVDKKPVNKQQKWSDLEKVLEEI